MNTRHYLEMRFIPYVVRNLLKRRYKALQVVYSAAGCDGSVVGFLPGTVSLVCMS